MQAKKIPKIKKKKDSRGFSHLPKQAEKKLKKMGDRDPDHWPKDAQKLLQELRARQRQLERQNKQLRDAQERLEYLASFPEMNPNPVVGVSVDGSIQYLNPAARESFPDLQKMGLRHEWFADLQSVGSLLEDKKKTSHVREIRIGKAWFEQIFFLTPTQDQLRIYGRDITEHKEAEEALEEARAETDNEKRRLEAVMEALPVGVAITDVHGGNIRSNKAYEEVWGNARPPALSVDDYGVYKAWWMETGEAVAPEDWASAQVVQRGQAVVGQLLEIERFDGSRATVINSGAPIFNANGKIDGCAVAIQDITSLRKAEQAVHEQDDGENDLLFYALADDLFHRLHIEADIDHLHGRFCHPGQHVWREPVARMHFPGKHKHPTS